MCKWEGVLESYRTVRRVEAGAVRSCCICQVDVRLYSTVLRITLDLPYNRIFDR